MKSLNAAVIVFLLTRGSVAYGQETQAPPAPPPQEEAQRSQFDPLDGDQNGRLTPQELFGREASEEAAVPFLERHRRAFQEADGDRDGVLNEQEFRDSDGLGNAAIAERWLWQNAWPSFQKRDADGDKGLSLEELLSGVEEDKKAERGRDFRLADFDANKQLSFLEYLCLPGVAPADRRGPVPDPIVEHMQQELAELKTLLSGGDTDSDGKWTQPEWPTAKVADRLSSQPLAAFKGWDRNRDGHVDQEELRLRLEVLYGIRHETGVRLRRENGMILFWRAFEDRDRNGDLFLTTKEVASFDASGKDAFEKTLGRLDGNKDGRLSLAELCRGSQMFWRDMLSEFRRIDSNLDGAVSAQELSERTAAWERSFLDQLFPAFDKDGDGRLTFREFRESPSGNPYRNWHPHDANRDGRVTLGEYHGGQLPTHIGLSHLLFTRIDQNHDGYLTLGEVDFEMDPSDVPVERLVRALDRNGDDGLTPQELFGRETSEEAAVPFLERHRRAFQQADRDRDGVLNEQEFRDSDGLGNAAIAERWLWKNAWPNFQKRDADGDKGLSLEELLSGVEEDKQAERGRDFRLADFDANKQLSFLEYLCLPGVAPADRRGPVPDPIVEHMQQELAELKTLLSGGDTDSDGKWTQPQWPTAKLADRLSSQPLAAFKGWDRNRDGHVDQEELRMRLEVLYGIRHETGVRLRRETGEVFFLRAFRDRDRNGDLLMTAEESIAFDPGAKESFKQMLGQLDDDKDGRLSLAEMGRGPQVFWRNIVYEFRRLDSDFDCVISPKELSEQTPPWEQTFVDQIFPAFDVDGDERLTFREFRGSPSANPYKDWNPQDASSDGKITLAEFHGGHSPTHFGLSKLFFSRLDRDQDGHLSLQEVSFRVDVNKSPLKIVFQVRDTDGDGRLSIIEAVGAPAPPGDDPTAVQKHEERLMLIEDAFRMADGDRDRHLSLQELQNSEEAVALMFPGRANRTRAANTGSPLGLPDEATASWDWRMIGIVSFNILLLAGLGWLVLRSAART